MTTVTSMVEAREMLIDDEYGVCELYDDERFYRVEKNPIGLFKVEKGVLYGEESEFWLALPKVEPVVWLRIIAFFKAMAQHHVEAAVNLFFDLEKRKYLLYVPKQRVGYGRCDIEYDDKWQNVASKYLFVAEFHSHHSMTACFSCIDDADEIGTRLFGVWGNYDANDDFFALTLRAGSGGSFAKVRVEDFLDDYFSRLHDSIPTIAIEPMFKPVEIVQTQYSEGKAVV